MKIKQYFIYFILLLAFITLSTACNNEKAEKKCLENFAAFDIGSGTTKLKIAEVDICARKLIKVINYMTSPVPYAQDMKSNHGKFSEEIIKYGTKTIDKLIESAKKYNVTKVLGVATSAFRLSSNGRDVISGWNKKFNLKFRVIDQKEEALLGYDSVALHDSFRYVVWDIGGGSMQIVENTDGKPFIYLGNIASVPFKNAVIEKIKKKELKTPNPMNQKEFEDSILLSMQLFNEEINNNKLKNFSSDVKFIGIGGLHKSLLPNGKNFYTYEDMEERAHSFYNKSDDQIDSKYKDTMVSNIALVMGFMKLFKIDKIEVHDVVLSDGLIYQELMY